MFSIFRVVIPMLQIAALHYIAIMFNLIRRPDLRKVNMIGGLVGWLLTCFVGWFGWLTSWLVGWSAYWLID